MNVKHDIEAASGFSERRFSLTEDYDCPPLIGKESLFTEYLVIHQPKLTDIASPLMN
jgi:hypothetical protein